MKHNINRTNDNTMARVYGPEFNYNTKEIINIIRKVYNLGSIDHNLNPKEIEVALLNYDYFVRPGEARTHFVMALRNTVKSEIYLVGIPDKDNERINNVFRTIAQFHLIKESFDKAYFEEQVKRRTAPISIESKRELRMHLRKLNRDTLEAFLRTVFIYNMHHGMFISEVSADGFWNEIHILCRAAGVNVPKELDTIEGDEFLCNNDGFYFNVLSLKTIADMLSDAIDLDIETATTAAEKLYNVGYDDMITYIKSNLVS